MICSGLYTAMITPFDERGELDEKAFRAHVSSQCQEGVDGLVVLGTTGEAPTLTRQEKERLVTIAREEKLHLMVGCGAISLKQTIENLHWAADLGADSALVVSPYYIKPSQEGLYLHFKALTKATRIPIVVYNIKARSAVNIETTTLKQIADLPQIIGVKESSGGVAQAADVFFEIKKSRPNFALLSGDDALTLPSLALGADGLISVISNLVPQKMKELIGACRQGKYTLAQEKYYDLFPLFKMLALEANPIVIKAAMNLCGFPVGNPRLPLTPLSETNQKILRDMLKNYEK